MDDVSRALCRDAYSLPSPAAGVRRAYGVQLASSNPCEDRFKRTHSISLWESDQWVASTVFDGHNGWQAAEHLKKELVHAVRGKLNKLSPKSRTDKDIQAAIEQAFTDLDDCMVGGLISHATSKTIPFDKKIPRMEAAWSGSCALLVLYNPNTKTLYTACTGDSRAILGKQNSEGVWSSEALSEDQNSENEAELARIRREHPGEHINVRNGRVLGLAVTRAFGDLRWKSSYDMQLEFGNRFAACGPMDKDDIPTPPYLTSRPVVSVHKITSDLPFFLVLATDGLWNNCENYEVLDLVVRWLEAQTEATIKELGLDMMKLAPETVWWKGGPQNAPIHVPGFDFLQRWNLVDVRFLPERTTIEDDNVAVHLLRNCLGGNHRELLAGRVAYQAPFARNVRDDITIQVIFF